ncbi:hypothetical protein FACS1894140_4740 [Spirochaetia bacterium]|nr:hypothetical protein FACS1894140_4740 [Spirochaetia bacterium]
MTLERIFLLFLKGVIIVTGTYIGKKVWDTISQGFTEAQKEKRRG